MYINKITVSRISSSQIINLFDYMTTSLTRNLGLHPVNSVDLANDDYWSSNLADFFFKK